MSAISLLERPPAPSVAATKHRTDVLALLALLVITALVETRVLVGGTVTGQDAATQFIPWYALLGERLRSGDILPGWNPYQFAGAPFAADPQSGWTSLPAMLLFTLLPVGLAVKSFVFGNVLLAGLFTYALARVLGLNAFGAFCAALAYELSLFVQDRDACCWAYTGLLTWLPLILLGAELAIRQRAWVRRFLWWGITGLALSQVLATWLGQGAYYVLLTLGSYVAYRTLLCPPTQLRSLWQRLTALALHGSAVLLSGALFGAAGLLPRVEYNRLSNLAAGYAGAEEDALIGGWSLGNWASIITRSDWHYAGIVVLLLAVLAPLPAHPSREAAPSPTRHATPFFMMLALSALVLSGQGPTPLHSLLYLLPGFAELHPHYPERVMSVFYLATALLAGTAVSRLWEGEWSGRVGATAAALGFAVLVSHIALPRVDLAWTTLLALGLAVALLVGGNWMTRMYPQPPGPIAHMLRRYKRSAAPVLLVALLCVDLLLAREGLGRHWPDHFSRISLEEYYRPTESARFLASQTHLYRFFGYDPSIRQEDIPYRYQWADPQTSALEVNNRATVHRLLDVQGYNPVHIARYDEYMRALNGRGQEYRGSYVLPTGLGSPLLDLLGVRYVVVPRTTPPGRADLQSLERRYIQVYAEDRARVLENPRALPWAWLVYSAWQVGRGDALQLLAKGKVDPRITALLEEEPPTLSPATRSQANVEEYAPDRIRVRVKTDAAGLLVLSEVYYPAWKARVNGSAARLYVANHALRAVPVGAGESVVELRYESNLLLAGTLISLASCALLSALAGVVGASYWRPVSRRR